MNIANEAISNELLFAGFNQDSGCFACGLSNGFAIYNVEPFQETFRRIFPNGGIGIVEMLFRCNVLAIVGGGRNPRYPTNKVMLWDDSRNKCIGDLKFRTEVKAVRLRRDKVVAVLESKVFVYRFKDLKLLDQITTVANPKGLVALCPDSSNTVLAIPGLSRGSVRVELYDIGKATLITAHDAELSYFALNSDGSRLATASEKGTLIRTWNCHTGEPIRELRRGMDRAEIYCISFSANSQYLACSSDKGTVHIFSLTGKNPQSDIHNDKNKSNKTNNNNNTNTNNNNNNDSNANYNRNNTSDSNSTIDDNTTTNKIMGGMGVQFLKGILPVGLVPKYFESEWSFSQVRGIDGKSICAFNKDSTKIVIVCADGYFIMANIEEGECTRILTEKYFKSSTDIMNDNNYYNDNSTIVGDSINDSNNSNSVNGNGNSDGMNNMNINPNWASSGLINQPLSSNKI